VRALDEYVTEHLESIGVPTTIIQLLLGIVILNEPERVVSL
jgi:hypothetical protein